MQTMTAYNPDNDWTWRGAENGAAAHALDRFAAGDVQAGRESLVSRAGYRDEQMTNAEVVAALGRTK
ncbi:hypothetical protein QN367_01900 [Cryobacterium sp. RTS3]|uniref:hypothetical protein n=1 Tax=Cryobacterium sp. RTS3 TaxID=3048643 RepID=UPI002B226F11|nr:hypothetical protein [Cryobacterium sp. RTS3]MEA9997844.1 hypothetical protein [Cryobacterium sp. RTS3]